MDKGKFYVKGRHLSVTPIITESYLFKTPDGNSHVVSINMSSWGDIKASIDGSDPSLFGSKVLKTSEYDSHIRSLYSKLYNAHCIVSDSYVNITNNLPSLVSISSIQQQLKDLKCKEFTMQPFDIEKPDEQNVKDDLVADAHSEENEDNEPIESYVEQRLVDELRFRQERWNDVKQYFDDLQMYVASIKNAQYREEYEEENLRLNNIINGSSDYVVQTLESMADNLQIPFSTDLYYEFVESQGLLKIQITAPTSIRVPVKTANMSQGGMVSFTALTQQEISNNISICILSSSFYLAWRFFNVSTTIGRIQIRTLSARSGYSFSWFDFKREAFAALNPRTFDVMRDCKRFLHYFVYENNKLEIISESRLNTKVANLMYTADARQHADDIEIPLSLAKSILIFNPDSLVVQEQLDKASSYGASIILLGKSMEGLVNSTKQRLAWEQTRKYRESETNEKLKDFYDSWTKPVYPGI